MLAKHLTVSLPRCGQSEDMIDGLTLASYIELEKYSLSIPQQKRPLRKSPVAGIVAFIGAQENRSVHIRIIKASYSVLFILLAPLEKAY